MVDFVFSCERKNDAGKVEKLKLCVETLEPRKVQATTDVLARMSHVQLKLTWRSDTRTDASLCKYITSFLGRVQSDLQAGAFKQLITRSTH